MTTVTSVEDFARAFALAAVSWLSVGDPDSCADVVVIGGFPMVDRSRACNQA